jgi:hypothetical protein
MVFHILNATPYDLFAVMSSQTTSNQRTTEGKPFGLPSVLINSGQRTDHCPQAAGAAQPGCAQGSVGQQV